MIVFRSEQAERDYRLFAGKTRQYIFISSASAYQKPPSNYRINEGAPHANPFWEYSRNKIACEEFFMKKYREEGFPFATVPDAGLKSGGCFIDSRRTEAEN